MRLTDNDSVVKSKFETSYPQLSEKLPDRRLESLSKEDNLFIFPHDLLDSLDLEKDGKVLETVNDQIKTQNIIGFLGCGEERLSIHSRFANGDDDYFLHYMLQKVLQLNLTSLDVGLSQEDSWYQLLIYLFPKYLEAALRKGLYKEYQHFFYNDSHVKGTIEVARHIKQNTPFTGKIAYSTREFSFDNVLMQLVRHTIAFIQHTVPNGRALLSSSSSVKENIAEIVRVTPSYRLSDRTKIIRENQNKPIRHTYYHEYRTLQRLCLMILSQEKHGLDQSNQKIHGLLFDVAWLWEEYLATLLPEFEHPQNKNRTGGYSLFQNGNGRIYPDFLSLSGSPVVADAKYKPMDNINGRDYLQVVAYMYRFDAKVGFYLFPDKKKSEPTQYQLLQGRKEKREYSVNVEKLGLAIPQGCTSYQDFISAMKEAEEAFRSHLYCNR
ncbi:McrC family protein [Streptococcus dentasini]